MTPQHDLFSHRQRSHFAQSCFFLRCSARRAATPMKDSSFCKMNSLSFSSRKFPSWPAATPAAADTATTLCMEDEIQLPTPLLTHSCMKDSNARYKKRKMRTK